MTGAFSKAGPVTANVLSDDTPQRRIGSPVRQRREPCAHGSPPARDASLARVINTC